MNTYMEEEVSLSYKFTNWKVYRNGKWETATSNKPMSPSQALKYFKGAWAVYSI